MKNLACLLIALNIFIIVAGNFLTPLWSKFVLSIGGDIRTTGTAICIFSVVIGLCTILAAKIENVFKLERSALVVSAIIICVGYFGYLYVKNPLELYIVQGILGLGSALQCPAIYALYQRTLPLSEETLGWGIWNGFYNMAIGVGAFISAEFAYQFSLTQVFYLLFAISIIGLLLSIVTAIKFKTHTNTN